MDLTRYIDSALSIYKGRYLKAIKGTASPRNAIGTKCLECCAWERTVASACGIQACPLWSYNPWRIRAAAKGAAEGADATKDSAEKVAGDD